MVGVGSGVAVASGLGVAEGVGVASGVAVACCTGVISCVGLSFDVGSATVLLPSLELQPAAANMTRLKIPPQTNFLTFFNKPFFLLYIYKNPFWSVPFHLFPGV